MIKSLTSLRGIFILFIFFHHCLDIYPGGGTMSVAFFFVLGGYSMTIGYKQRLSDNVFNYRDYLCRRFVKFYPLHWLCILLVFPLVLLSFTWKQIPVFFINAALLQSWFPIHHVYFSYNWVSWYLADTMFFTAVFPPLFRWIISSSYKIHLIVILSCAVFYFILVTLLPKVYYHPVLYISPLIRLFDFSFGVVLALIFIKLLESHKVQKIGSVIGNCIVFLFIGLLVLESCVIPDDVSLIAPVYWPLVGMIIISASLIRGGANLLENKLLLRLGELSFTIFMIHQIVLRYISYMFDNVFHYGNNVIYIALTLVLTIIFSLIIERYFLNPITKWLTKKNQPYMTAQS